MVIEKFVALSPEPDDSSPIIDKLSLLQAIAATANIKPNGIKNPSLLEFLPVRESINRLMHGFRLKVSSVGLRGCEEYRFSKR